MDTVLQQLFAGLAIGCVYGLIALGFAMTLVGADLVNFAHGEYVMLGAFLGYTLTASLHFPYWITFPVVIITVGLYGVLVERVLLRPMRLKKSPMLNLLIATLGLSTTMQILARIIWGPKPFRYPPIFPETPILLGPLRILPLNLWIILIAVILMFLIHLFFYKTLTGISWRAASLDRPTAELMGVNVDLNIALTFGISSALGGAAGVLFGPLYFVTYSMGAGAIKAFAAAAMGQFTILGSMIGGPILGAIETLSAGLISSAYNNAFAYGLMIIVLLAYSVPKSPPGQVAKESRERSTAVQELLQRMPRLAHIGTGSLIALLVLVILLPLFVSNSYVVFILTMAVIYSIAAIGLQIIVGFTGQISFATAAFYGLGAYTSAILATKAGLPVWIGLILAPLVAGLLSLCVAPILKLGGHYLAVATLGFGLILYLVFTNWVNLTSGPQGILAIPFPTLGPIDFAHPTLYFYLSLVLLGLVYLALHRLTHSCRFGRALIAVRENELAAVTCGVNALGYKMKAFVIGSACAGLAGALYAHFTSYISSESFNLDTSISMLAMVVLGGLGSLPGAVIGALCVMLLPEALRGFAENRMLIYGILLMLFMVFLPGGLIDIITRPLHWLASRLLRRLERPRPARIVE